jgi:Family of unknown function (DUF6516)
MTRATRLRDYHRKFSNGDRVDITIWKLPRLTKERPHGLKYRLNYSLPDGTNLVRYDNETGKADHKHIRNIELRYKFTTVRQLFRDFAEDIKANGGTL